MGREEHEGIVGLLEPAAQEPVVVSHLEGIDRRTRKLARSLFHQMLRQGAKLEMRQLILARVIDIGAELAVMALVVSRYQAEKKQGNEENRSRTLYWLASRRPVVEHLFEGRTRAGHVADFQRGEPVVQEVHGLRTQDDLLLAKLELDVVPVVDP